MRKIESTVYAFAELDDKAKDRARDWYRSGALDYEWWDGVFDDAERAGLKITSFGLDRNRHADGKFITGARECAQAIVDEHGAECETYKTAEAFLRERDEAVDSAPRDADGEFENEYALDTKLDDIEADFLKSILEDYSINLQREYEYLMSDEQVDECIESNDYEFTIDGERA